MKNIREVKKERLKMVEQMYGQKMSVTEIAKELGCAISTASHYLKELGIKDKRKIEINKAIKELHCSGVSINTICKKLNVSNPYVRAVLRRYGYITNKRYVTEEIDLIDENTVFADNSVKLEKLKENGKIYEDILPLIIPR